MSGLAVCVVTTLLLMSVVDVDVDAVNEYERRISRFDYMNMDLFFNSRRLFTNYVDCMLGKRNCPPEGLDLKKQMPSLLKKGCPECSMRQREILVKIFFRMQDDYKPELKALLKRWDPTGQYYVRFVKFLEKNFPNEVKDRANNTASNM